MDLGKSQNKWRRHVADGLRRAPLFVLAITTAVGVSVVACAGPGAVTNVNTSADIACADDSPRCLEARARGLTALRADGQRNWLKQRPGAREYAAGVRLFALKRDKTDLNCSELAAGLAEAKRSAEVLRGPQGRELSPGQISRGIILADEVGRELERERRRRCG